MLPPELTTERLILKAYSPPDQNRFIEMSIDQESTQFMGNATGDFDEEKKLFKKILEIYATDQERWFWIWGIFEEKQLCGHLELKQTEHTNPNELEIVYMVHPNERRKGIMTEALSCIKQQQSTWQRRIIATVSPDNLASISLLKKWGIEKEESISDPESGETYLKLTLA
ncbi:MAG: GNAT family N-acetyltransferase [Bacteroidota bacterium]